MVTVVPSMLLSGFAFPCAACPGAKGAIEPFPATHYLVIVRGVLMVAGGVAAGAHPGFATFFCWHCAFRKSWLS